MTARVLLADMDTDIVSSALVSSGGEFIIVVRGTDFGSGIVTIEYSPRPLENEVDAKWSTLQNATFTSDGERRISFIPAGHGIRARLSNTAVLASTDNIFVEARQ